MERSPNPHSTETTHNFLLDAQADGAIGRYRENSKSGSAARNLNILAIYNGTYFNYTDIAIEAGITRERARQVEKRTKLAIWRLCSPEIRSKYHRDDLLKTPNKPTYPQIESSAQALLVQMYQEQELSSQKIQELTGITSRNQKKIAVANKRVALRIKEKESVHKSKSVWKTIEKIIKESPSDDLVQMAFDILDFYHATKIAKKEDSSLVTFTSLLENSPIRHAEEIYAELKRNNIPVLRIKMNFGEFHPHLALATYYIPNRYADRALNCLQNSDIKHTIEPKVSQISGPTTDLPTTHQLQYSGDFQGIFTNRESKRIQGYLRKNLQLSILDLVKDCPYPTFKMKSLGYKCKNEDKAKIRAFLDKRLQELGLQVTKKQ